MNEIKTIAEKFKNDKKLIIIVLAGIIGVILLLFSGESDNKTVNSDEKTENKQTETIQIKSIEETEKLLSDKISGIVSSISGVGSVSVAVSVASSGKYVYAENLKSETDSDSFSTDSELVILSADDNPALLLCISAPEITGVAVVCQGGSSAVIREEVIKLISGLLGIGSDKIYVGNKS